MSQLRFEQSKTLYLRSAGSLLSRFIGSNNSTSNDSFFRDCNELNDLKAISPSTKSIAFIGHSESNLFTAGHSVSNLGAKDLAKQLAGKYGDADKLQLEHFYLISCEAGLGQPSFAQLFAEEMHALGFKNIRVHASCPPKNTKPTGMIVETEMGVNQNISEIKISSWYYASRKDEERDGHIVSEIKVLDQELIDINAKLSTRLNKEDRQQLKQKEQDKITQKEACLTEQTQLRHFIISTPVPYERELQKPENTLCGGAYGKIIDLLMAQKEKLRGNQEITTNIENSINQLKEKQLTLSEIDALSKLNMGFTDKDKPNTRAYFEQIVRIKLDLEMSGLQKNEVASQYVDFVSRWVELQGQVFYEEEINTKRNFFIKTLMKLVGSDPLGVAQGALNDHKTSYNISDIRTNNEKNNLFLTESKLSLEKIKADIDSQLHKETEDRKSEAFLSVESMRRWFGFSEDALIKAESMSKASNSILESEIKHLETAYQRNVSTQVTSIISSLFNVASSVVSQTVNVVADTGAKFFGFKKQKITPQQDIQSRIEHYQNLSSFSSKNKQIDNAKSSIAIKLQEYIGKANEPGAWDMFEKKKEGIISSLQTVIPDIKREKILSKNMEQLITDVKTNYLPVEHKNDLQQSVEQSNSFGCRLGY